MCAENCLFLTLLLIPLGSLHLQLSKLVLDGAGTRVCFSFVFKDLVLRRVTQAIDPKCLTQCQARDHSDRASQGEIVCNSVLSGITALQSSRS